VIVKGKSGSKSCVDAKKKIKKSVDKVGWLWYNNQAESDGDKKILAKRYCNLKIKQ